MDVTIWTCQCSEKNDASRWVCGKCAMVRPSDVPLDHGEASPAPRAQYFLVDRSQPARVEEPAEAAANVSPNAHADTGADADFAPAPAPHISAGAHPEEGEDTALPSLGDWDQPAPFDPPPLPDTDALASDERMDHAADHPHQTHPGDGYQGDPAVPPAVPESFAPPRFRDVPPVRPPRAPRTRPSWVTPQNALFTGLAAFALVGILATIAVTGNNKPPDPSQVTSLGPPNTDSEAQILQGEVNTLARYVEKARGLTFVHQVTAVVYDDKTFDAQLKALGGAKLDRSAELAGRVATAQALGLLPLDYNPNSPAATSTANILGFYDPTTKRLAVRGAYVSPYVRKTLVHELTHALQDQHFDLQKLLAVTDDDQSLAVRSLVEGDARRVENAYISTLGPLEQDLLQRDAQVKGDNEFPVGFALGFDSFPYVQGSHFTQNLVGMGGQAQLDKAFANPPRSSKQIIQPSRYVEGDNPIAVASPPADGAIIDHGTFGEFELVYVLGQTISLQAAAQLTSDWAGSAFVTWRGSAGPCTRIRLANETAEGTARMSVALQAWASVDPKRSVSGENPITVGACA